MFLHGSASSLSSLLQVVSRASAKPPADHVAHHRLEQTRETNCPSSKLEALHIPPDPHWQLKRTLMKTILICWRPQSLIAVLREFNGSWRRLWDLSVRPTTAISIILGAKPATQTSMRRLGLTVHHPHAVAGPAKGPGAQTWFLVFVGSERLGFGGLEVLGVEGMWGLPKKARQCLPNPQH